jgi:hypothetical protein
MSGNRETMSYGGEKQAMPVSPVRPWVWPLDMTCYDRAPICTSAEREALAPFVQRPRDRAVVVAEACQQG